MTLQEKINLIVELNNPKYTEIDIELLRKLSPGNKAFKRIRSINQHNRKDIGEKALSALLDLSEVTRETILKNREKDINESISGSDKKKEETPGTQNLGEQSQDGSGSTSTPSDGEKPKKTPKDLFPKIDWTNTDNEQIQLCILLFNDAVVQYNKQKELDGKIDDNPELAAKMVEADIRNKQAFKELEEFEKTGNFIWNHPILKKNFLKKELLDLYKKDAADFLNQFNQTKSNEKNYKSKIKNKKYKDDNEKEAWQGHLDKYSNKAEVMAEILEEQKPKQEDPQ